MLYPAIIASFHTFFQEVWMAEKWHKVNKSEIHQYYRKLYLYQAQWKYNHAASLLHKAHVDYGRVTFREIVSEVTYILH